MNMPETDTQSVVAPGMTLWQLIDLYLHLKIMNVLVDLTHASLKDFAAVGLLFRSGDDYIWKTHSFARKEFLDKYKLKPPIHEWEKKVCSRL